ncbi:hypothetical protein N1851_003812 [Merluccius polli]|uniref:Endonuclease/exonuclease/phosphatase domain-containing protein n=1 Tax=Merluccius polli TaxID=89951 RepID=A0AA47N9E5_MERPO|nr:hypothetical protein N1851_003812 [Merluccius polli]
MDEMELQMATNSFVQNCSVIVITETWLHPLIPGAAVELAGRMLLRQDRDNRDRDLGKSRSGGLCVYINSDWCAVAVGPLTHTVRLIKRFWQSRADLFISRGSFTIVIVIAVYIPPKANVSTALSLLLDITKKQQLAHPDGVFIVAGDFNQACLKTVLPKFIQHVKLATRGGKYFGPCLFQHQTMLTELLPSPILLDLTPLCLSLTPTYTPLRRQTKPITKTIKTWPKAALSQLQDCFSRTLWDLFFSHDLQEHVDTVLSYIKNCVDMVTVDKRVRVFPNQKPWMNSEVQSLLKSCNTAFKSRDRDWPLYSTARSALKRLD